MYLSIQKLTADSSSSFTDESGWDDPNGETDSNFDNSQSQTSWKCLKCRAPTSAPCNFCFTCFQVLVIFITFSRNLSV